MVRLVENVNGLVLPYVVQPAFVMGSDAAIAITVTTIAAMATVDVFPDAAAAASCARVRRRVMVCASAGTLSVSDVVVHLT